MGRRRQLWAGAGARRLQHRRPGPWALTQKHQTTTDKWTIQAASIYSTSVTDGISSTSANSLGGFIRYDRNLTKSCSHLACLLDPMTMRRTSTSASVPAAVSAIT